MAPLNASVLWCGVAGTVSQEAEMANYSYYSKGPSLLAQEAREFGCSGCNIIELGIAGSRRMLLKAPAQQLQWTHEDFVSCDSDDAAKRPSTCGSKRSMSNVEEFAARRMLTRMLQQEDHEVFSSLGEWRSATQGSFEPGWRFSETFDGRLLLLPFFHRAQTAAESVDDVTLLLHMDSSRLKNLDNVVTSWGGLVSVVVIVYVASRMWRSCFTKLDANVTTDILRTLTPRSSP
jgi:hypothetical protein